MPRRKILLAGLFHETHTFLEELTGWDEFAVRRGDELLSAAGDGSPLAAVVEFARESDWDLIPAIDARATPSATVEDRVLAEFWRELETVARPALAAGIDGMFLVLHGAMVTQTCLDVEGEVLSRLRALPGGDSVPIAGVLDLHANLSARMCDSADALHAYRENPHGDAHQAARDAARLLELLLETGNRPATVFEQTPIVWPPTGTGTDTDPMRTLEHLARRIEADRPEILAVNVLAGFSFADTPDTGVSFSAVTLGNPDQARDELRKLSRWAYEHRREGNVLDPPVDDVLLQIKRHREGPIVLVEPADNIGGGAPGDGTGLLRALLAAGIENAAVAINDPAVVAALGNLPIGGRATLPIGGRGSRLDPGPIELEVELVSRSDGRFELEDRQSHLASIGGIHIDMGPCAVVRHRGVTILLTSKKTPPFDLGQLRSQGIEPTKLFAIGVKAAVAHGRAYNPIANASYRVDTPGPCSSDLSRLPYRHIRRPVFPLDRERAVDA